MIRNKIAPAFAVATGLVLVLGVALPAFALTANATASTSAKVEARQATAISKGQDKAKQEITRRIDALTKMGERVNQMQRLSDSEKATLSTNFKAQIDELTTLAGKVDADTDAATLKTDVQSITKSYRVFALVMPQAAIQAAADRVETIVSMMNTVSTKLAARIATSTSAGKNTAALSASLTDMNAKTADAHVQAQAAVTEVASLTPDNGDQTVMKSNATALKDARSKIQAAQQDLVAARKDATSIVKGLKAFNLEATASSTVSTH